MNFLFEAGKAEAPVTVMTFPEMPAKLASSANHDGEQCRESAADAIAEGRRIEAACEQRLAHARAEGHAEGLVAAEARRKEDLEIERSAVSHLCIGFARERKKYFAEVEGEVVKLALAIAARVLQRESVMDPTLLKGVAKVALEKLGDVRGAVLRMHPRGVEVWQAAMTHSGLEIAGDTSMGPGDLRLEAAGSVAELGVAAQLLEVERGFFDLMARRPA